MQTGVRGAVFGHPGGGPLEASPFRVDRRIRAVGRDIYGAARTERDVLVLAADLEPGDSGSALVSPDGDVVGVAFAIAPDRPGVAYALTPAEVRAALARVPCRPRHAAAHRPLPHLSTESATWRCGSRLRTAAP